MEGQASNVAAEDRVRIGALLRAAREKRGWTRSQLAADSSHLDEKDIQRIETGGSYSMQKLKAVLERLNLTLEEIQLKAGSSGFPRARREEYVELKSGPEALRFLAVEAVHRRADVDVLDETSTDEEHEVVVSLLQTVEKIRSVPGEELGPLARYESGRELGIALARLHELGWFVEGMHQSIDVHARTHDSETAAYLVVRRRPSSGGAGR